MLRFPVAHFSRSTDSNENKIMRMKKRKELKCGRKMNASESKREQEKETEI